MVKVEINGVNTTRKKLADGRIRTYRYHRDTGLPLRGDPGSAQFIVDYAAAEKHLRDRHRGTVSGLIRDFSLSIEFEQRAPSTQTEYRRMLTKIEHQFGTMPIAALEDQRVRGEFMKWRELIARKSGLRESDNRLSVLSAVLSWAVANGQISANHVRGFERLHSADRSENLWLPEHIDAFQRVASAEILQALMLALHTGARQNDILRFAWSNYDGECITYRQRRKGRRGGAAFRSVVVPVTPALKKMLDGAKRRAAVILTTPTGAPWKKRYFSRRFKETTVAAGIQDRVFHDLRGTAVTMLAEAGCTVPEIATITGHSLKTATSILEKYLPRTRHLADAAILNFGNAASTSFANHLQTGTAVDRKGGSK